MKPLDSYTYGEIKGSICANEANYCFEGQNSKCYIIRGDTVFIITNGGMRFESKVINIDIDNQIIYFADRDIFVNSIVFLGRID